MISNYSLQTTKIIAKIEAGNYFQLNYVFFKQNTSNVGYIIPTIVVFTRIVESLMVSKAFLVVLW